MTIQPEIPQPVPRPGALRWLRERLFPQSEELIRLAAYVILFIVIIVFVLDRPAQLTQPRFNGTILTLTALLLLNLLWARVVALFAEPRQGETACLILSALLTLTAVYLGYLTSGIYLVFMLAAQSSLILMNLRQSLLFIGLTSAGYLLILAVNGASPEMLISVGVSGLIGLVFTLTLAQVLLRYAEQTRRSEDLLHQLQVVNAQLVAAREKERDLAIAEERVRLARDIHDGLGHHLTVLSIQLQAAEKFLRTSPELAEEAVRSSRQEAQAALKEVRQSVAALRQSPVDASNLAKSIADLVRDFDQRSGLRARLHSQGECAGLTPAAAQTLYRAAQEGLTNAQKHAGGAQQVEIWLELAAEGARLVVSDDGTGGQPARQDTGGFGLAGIRERVSQLGGTLQTGPAPDGGFQVRLWIPVGKAAE